MADKVQKSLRFDRDLAERVAALKEPGESDAGVYGRVVDAGVNVLESGGGGAVARDPLPIGEKGKAVPPADAPGNTVAALEKAIDALAAQLEAKDNQLAAKDEQIVTLSRLTDQAQRLQAADAQQRQQVLATADTKRGILARLFGR